MKMPWLNYHHLYYFYAVASTGSIARACEKLRLGQSTLSTQLKQLENMVGSPLFERKNRGLVLTEAGRVALQYAQEIFTKGDELLSVLVNKAHRGLIPVRIGALDNIPKRLLVKIVAEAQRVHQCVVSLLEGHSHSLFQELFDHQLDLVVSNHPLVPLEPGRAYSRSIAKSPVSVFGARKFSRLKKGFPQSLHEQPLVLPTAHSKLRHDFDHFCKRHQLSISILAETQDTSLQKLLGIEGLGLIPIPDFAAEDLVRENRLIHIGTLPAMKEEFWLISATRRIENQVALHLMKHFRMDGQ